MLNVVMLSVVLLSVVTPTNLRQIMIFVSFNGLVQEGPCACLWTHPNLNIIFVFIS